MDAFLCINTGPYVLRISDTDVIIQKSTHEGVTEIYRIDFSEVGKEQAIGAAVMGAIKLSETAEELRLAMFLAEKVTP